MDQPDKSIQVQKVSTNLPILHKQLKKIYLEEATRVDSSGIAVQIVQSCYETKIADVPLATTEQGQVDILSIITQIRALVGASKDVTPRQLEIEAGFVKKTFSDYAVSDFILAMELFLNNKLDIDVTSFVVFSPMFISYIMNAYIRYKRKTLTNVLMLSEKSVLMLEKATNQERLTGLKECILECCSGAKTEFDGNRFFNEMVYSFLFNTRRMKVTLATIDEGKEYARRKFLEDRQKNIDKKRGKDATPLGDAIHQNPAAMFDKRQALTEYTKDYCLIKYFKETDVDKMLSSILETELPKKI